MGNCLCKQRERHRANTTVMYSKGRDQKAVQIKKADLTFAHARVARGSAGEVWKATWNHGGIAYDVAVKKYSTDKLGETECKKEKKVHKRLHHDHIVRLHGYVKSGRSFWLVMEAGGETLRQHKQRRAASNHPMTMAEKITVLTQIADALSYMFGRGFTHNDIYDCNVLVTQDGPFLNVKLIDFDMAKEYKEEDQRATESRNNDVLHFGRLITTLFANEPEIHQAIVPVDPHASQELITLTNRCEATALEERPLFAEIFTVMKAIHARVVGHPYSTCETVGYYLAALSTETEINLLMTGPSMTNTMQAKRSFDFGESQQVQYGEIITIGNVQLHISEIPAALDGIIGATCKGLVYVTTSSAEDLSLVIVVESNCEANGSVLALVKKEAGYERTRVETRIRAIIGDKRKLCIRMYDSDDEDMGDALIWMLNQLTTQKK